MLTFLHPGSVRNRDSPDKWSSIVILIKSNLLNNC